MRNGYLIAIPSKGRTSQQYREARARMKNAGLTDNCNQFKSRQEALDAMDTHKEALPDDAYVSEFSIIW